MRSVPITSGPLVASVANAYAASQTPYAGQIVLNGANATFSINNVAASQDPAGAGNLTLASSPVSFSAPRYLYITSAADDTTFTFTVTGLDVNGQPLTEVITGANTKARASVNRFVVVSNIAVSGNSGSVQVGSFANAAPAVARRVLLTTTGNEVGKSFVVTGLDRNGFPISETIAGVNNTTATGVLDFAVITSITISAEAANALTIGTASTAGGPWFRLDDWAPSNIAIQCNVSGTANFTVQSTLDDPFDPVSPVLPAAMTWINTSDTAAVAASASLQTNFLFAPKYVRVQINSGTGSVTTTILQSSNGPI
jgi:hypothetical protein